MIRKIVMIACCSGTLLYSATIRNSVGMVFASIPSGVFKMGSPAPSCPNDDALAGTEDYVEYMKCMKRVFVNETPAHEVRVGRYYLQTTEVTQQQWKTVMGSMPIGDKYDPQYPVDRVSWNDTQRFIEKLNALDSTDSYRLPTEAEWEYAARAGNRGNWSFGDDPNELQYYAWYEFNSNNQSHPVATKKPNHWGLYDMYGNVYEWTQDCWVAHYKGAPATAAPLKGNCQYHTIRGGSYMGLTTGVRSAVRYYNGADSRTKGHGFRLLMITK